MHPLGCSMCSILVPVLILQFFISFPAVAGDCFDKPSNNKTYDNCASCYQTLANALLNTDDNKYQLGKAFFPVNAVPPVEVRAVYVQETEDQQCNTTSYAYMYCHSEQDPEDNTTSTWYWLEGEMYIYQPMEIFALRSLFFSPPSWRQECVILCLPEKCLMKDSEMFNDFFKFLTQRVRCS